MSMMLAKGYGQFWGFVIAFLFHFLQNFPSLHADSYAQDPKFNRNNIIFKLLYIGLSETNLRSY